MSAQNIITQRNLIKKPQFVTEGITAATYGVTPTNPVFIQVGQDASLVEESNPTVAENRIVGDVDRKETTKTFEENTVKFMAKLMAVDKTTLQWLMNKPVIPETINTPDESRTWTWSYSSDAGAEIFKTYRGCKPIDYSISVDTEGYLILECTLSFDTITNATPLIGTGSFGTDLVGTPLIHTDAGANPFMYNGQAVSIETFTLSGNYTMAHQNALGTVKPLYMKATMRALSGNIVIYKQDETLQVDARAATEREVIFILDTGNLVISYSTFKLMPSGEELKGDTSEATKENKSWEAGAVEIA